MLTNFVDFLGFIPPFLAVLLVIVFVHELGHYLVARWNGVAVQTFSIGFGPEVIGFTDKRGTRWRLSWIPLGGYVRFLGDMNVSSSLADDDLIKTLTPEQRRQLFVNKSVWQRIAVVLAGPVANILFTLLVLYALLLGYGRYTLPPVIDDVTIGSVAAEAGLESGDRVLRVDGYEVRGFEDFQRLISTAPERQVTITVARRDATEIIRLVPEATVITDRFGNEHRVGRIGVSSNVDPDEIELYRPDPIAAVGMAFEEVLFILDRTADFIGDFFVGRGDVDQLGGPVKVAQVSGQVASLGLVALINLMALLSLNIGVFNLLPIPLLDGGHLAYYAVEAVRGRPLSQRVQEIGYRFGLAIVFSLMVFTFINDLI